MPQVWGNMMRSCEIRAKELLDANVITPADLHEWLKAKNGNEGAIVGVGLPCYSFLQSLLHSIKAGSGGILLFDDLEITHMNRPQDRLLDWFFQPIMVLKEQIKVLKLTEGEVRHLEKLVLLGSNTQRMEAWENGSFAPQDAVRAAQIQGISRRMMGMTRSITKFPTYRRRFRQIVKALISHYTEKESKQMAATAAASSTSTAPAGSPSTFAAPPALLEMLTFPAAR
ncbi:uncharacterized membrane protein At3g27390-like [Malania oleifera]|uniref:uncharacterized membrane protein At3g27390-like n=1 Tax=Malania oleifera TaxID=397392 RepID=UPI0025AE95A1|nr:uncharacterized membrane protein At3g27390-like [Malania oleifera]